MIQKLRFENFLETSIDTDYYRIIITDEWTDFDNNIEPAVGSLIDDVKSLKQLIEDPNGFCTYVDFDRFASVLRYISEKRTQ